MRPVRVAAPLALAAIASLLVPGGPLAAQRLRDDISQLFIFGPGEEPLFLAGTADPNNPASVRAHGRHFVPASAAENAAVIGFLTDALGASVSNMPIGSTSGGETFRFEGGVPVRTSTSAGPIFAERAMTLGRGRLLAGLSRSGFRFATIRGIPLHDVRLTFTHENVDYEGCSAANGGANCALMGVPNLENDVIDLRLSLDLKVAVTSLYVTYGVTDRLDVSAVIPVVSTQLAGSSEAQIVPFGGPTAVHFFAGTPSSPVLNASRSTSGSATGLGDVAVRAKLALHTAPRASVAVLADARFPTGSADDLLGAGGFSARGLAVLSAMLGDFSPHANVGYVYRRSGSLNDAVLATGGFDHRISDKVTLAADVVGELQVGDSKLHIPEPVRFDVPFRRTALPTTIPDVRDDVVNGSFGFKVMPRRDLTAVFNALFPLNRGGVRPDITYTVGLEVTL
jgi:hypothetical protein